MRQTLNLARVLRELLDAPGEPRYGYDLARQANVSAGSLYPILSRLEGVGWLDSRWEEADPEREGRPRRRYYRLTAAGAAGAAEVLADLHRQLGVDPSREFKPGYA